MSKNADTVLVDSAPVPTLMVPWNVPVSQMVPEVDTATLWVRRALSVALPDTVLCEPHLEATIANLLKSPDLVPRLMLAPSRPIALTDI